MYLFLWALLPSHLVEHELRKSTVQAPPNWVHLLQKSNSNRGAAFSNMLGLRRVQPLFLPAFLAHTLDLLLPYLRPWRMLGGGKGIPHMSEVLQLFPWILSLVYFEQCALLCPVQLLQPFAPNCRARRAGSVPLQGGGKTLVSCMPQSQSPFNLLVLQGGQGKSLLIFNTSELFPSLVQ